MQKILLDLFCWRGRRRWVGAMMIPLRPWLVPLCAKKIEDRFAPVVAVN